MIGRSVNARLNILEREYSKVNITDALSKVLDAIVAASESEGTPNETAADKAFDETWNKFQKLMMNN